MSQGRTTLQIVLGTIIAVFGGAALLRFLLVVGPAASNSAYATGQTVGATIGLVFLLIGARAVYKGVRQLQAPR